MIKAVEYIFAQCSATYGAAWDRSLGQAPIADIKTAWLSAVEPFSNSFEASDSAIKNNLHTKRNRFMIQLRINQPW